MMELGYTLPAESVVTAPSYSRRSTGEAHHNTATNFDALSSWAQAGLRFGPGDQSIIQARAHSLDDELASRGTIGNVRPEKCTHCKRRKIRCLPVTDDPQSRCSNCIRLKRECIRESTGQTTTPAQAPNGASHTEERTSPVETASGMHLVDIGRSNRRSCLPAESREPESEDLAAMPDSTRPVDANAPNANFSLPLRPTGRGNVRSRLDGLEQSIAGQPADPDPSDDDWVMV